MKTYQHSRDLLAWNFVISQDASCTATVTDTAAVSATTPTGEQSLSLPTPAT
jgi:hypothetical protein